MSYPYLPRTDSRVELTGTYSAGQTAFTLPIADTTIDSAVTSSAFGVLAGVRLEATVSADGSTAFVAGNWTAGPCILGRTYNMSVELSRPYRRDRQGDAVVSDRLQLVSVYTSHSNAGPYTVRVAMPRRSDRTKRFDPGAASMTEEAGELRYFASGKLEELRIFLESDGELPVAVSATEFGVDVAQGRG